MKRGISHSPLVLVTVGVIVLACPFVSGKIITLAVGFKVAKHIIGDMTNMTIGRY